MCLSTKNQVVAVHRVHVGGLNVSLVLPREVFKAAILNNSASVIFSHQHPSQICDPSDEDVSVTQRLVECGKILGIEVLDHIIVNAKAVQHERKKQNVTGRERNLPFFSV
jgi:DNA repair protein RadC